MPFDWNTAFGANAGYAPDWVTGLTEQKYRDMMRNLYSRSLLAPPAETAQFTSDVVNPFVAANQGVWGTGQPANTSQLGEFARNYWDWLQGGASTYKDVATAVPSLASNALHYVSGVGYVKEGDLKQYDPRGYAAIAQQRAAEAANPAINPYWEEGVGPNARQWTQNVSRRPSWMPNYGSYEQFNRAGATGAGGGAGGAGGGAGAGVNYSAGAGNRVGNVATTSRPGQTAVTPNAWTGDYQQQARERAAKRMGRDISQSGVTRVPNAKEELSRRTRQRFRRY